jgi:hypothetical protein
MPAHAAGAQVVCTGGAIITIDGGMSTSTSRVACVGGTRVTVITANCVVNADPVQTPIGRTDVAVVTVDRCVGAAGCDVAGVDRARIAILATRGVEADAVHTRIEGAGVAVATIYQCVAATGGGIAGVDGTQVAVIAANFVMYTTGLRITLVFGTGIAIVTES